MTGAGPWSLGLLQRSNVVPGRSRTLHPMTARRTAVPSGRVLLDAEHLVARLKAKRRGLNFTLREAADAVGVSAATLSRIETGERLPGRESLLRIAHWLGVGLDLSGLPPPLPRSRRATAAPTTVEAVELYLRADRALTPAEADALSSIFRAAYEAFKTARRPSRRPATR